MALSAAFKSRKRRACGELSVIALVGRAWRAMEMEIKWVSGDNVSAAGDSG